MPNFHPMTLAAALSIALLPADNALAANPKITQTNRIEFIGMPAPASAEEKTSVYSKAHIKITYRNGKSTAVALSYHALMATADKVGNQVVGGLYDHNRIALSDSHGQLASDAPDGNSLLSVPGMQASQSNESNALALITQYEYKNLPPAGLTGSFWSKLPSTMSLANIEQNKKSGRLHVTGYRNIDFSSVRGLWVACAASLSPWNTHLGGEESEPDAKVRSGGSKAADSDNDTDLLSFSKYYFGDAATANPYHYGLVPEVTVLRDGTTQVIKHHVLGRISHELVDVLPDRRTVYMGDDGKNAGLFLFIADHAGDLSAGTLYAGKWIQTSAQSGGSAALGWIRLGSASDADIRTLVDQGLTFNDIFAVSLTDPNDSHYRKVTTYTGTEWLRLKPAMEKAAAFLETRRYAAYLGATTEFSKMEGITHDPRADAERNGTAFVVISRLEQEGMADPSGDIQLARNDGGAIYALSLTGNQRDSNGSKIDSSYVARDMVAMPELLGGWLGKNGEGKDIKDAEGNRCEQDKLCGPDNIKFSPRARTLFIGEDTSRRNNNYVWAFNVDTRKLSRILSIPMGAEATGLQVVENSNGFSYIMSNFQHPGEGVEKTYLGVDKQDVLNKLNSKWNNLQRATIGYIGSEHGALPAWQ